MNQPKGGEDMPETTTVTEAVRTAVSEGGLLDWLVAQEWFPYAVIALVIIGIVLIVIDPAPKQEEKCPCCESGGQVIGGVRLSETEMWIKPAAFCPLCGKPLNKDPKE